MPAPLHLLGDERLARLASEGDRRAFDVLFGRHRRAIERCVGPIVRNDHDAQDVLQSTALKALTGLPARNPGAPLRAWLLRIASNEAISVLRRRRARPSEELAERVPDASGTPEERAFARDDLRHLLADIEHLTERQRRALLLRQMCGMDYEEVGGLLHTTPLAARQSVFAARRALLQHAAGRRAAALLPAWPFALVNALRAAFTPATAESGLPVAKALAVAATAAVGVGGAATVAEHKPRRGAVAAAAAVVQVVPKKAAAAAKPAARPRATAVATAAAAAAAAAAAKPGVARVIPAVVTKPAVVTRPAAQIKQGPATEQVTRAPARREHPAEQEPSRTEEGAREDQGAPSHAYRRAREPCPEAASPGPSPDQPEMPPPNAPPAATS